jgi:hypothetical protein
MVAVVGLLSLTAGAVLAVGTGGSSGPGSSPAAITRAGGRGIDAGSAAPSGGPQELSTAAVPTPPSASIGPGAANIGVPSSAATAPGHFGLGLLIADRGNGRLLIVNQAGRTLWRFPTRGSLPHGQAFAADDAFLAPDGRTIVANDEAHNVVDRIDIVSHRVIWQYGRYDRAGSSRGLLHTPDDAYPLADGTITVADIRNCRVLAISPAKRIVHQWGRTGQCSHRPPWTYDNPNGDTPLAGGGMLITEIGGSRVVRLSPRGHVVYSVHVPAAYPSDAHLDGTGDILVVDYAATGSVLRVDRRGHVVWRYRPLAGSGRLDHPSLAILLPDGMIAVNDDFRHRVIVIDPRTRRIVWQYGHTDRPGRAPGYLFVPDGIDVIPVGTRL